MTTPKTKEGWREPQKWDTKSPDIMFNAFTDALQSHDGWECPRCGRKDRVGMDCGLTNESYINLMVGGDPEEMRCNSCDQNYWLKAFVVTKYTTSTTEKFED